MNKPLTTEYRIVLADDHEIFRAGLKSLIDKEGQFRIVGEAKDGQALLALLKKVKCDVIVLDLSMPTMDGMTVLRMVRDRYPKLKILVLTMLKDPEHFRHAMMSGAAGYVLKDDAYEELVLALRVIVKGKQFVSQPVSSLLTERYVRSLDEVETPSLAILTKREQQILKMVAAGLPNKAVAAKLNISVRTVETHRANLSNKLGIKTTAVLVKYAIVKGLV